jgi:thiol-disulfide isomerase/thioredoxin
MISPGTFRKIFLFLALFPTVEASTDADIIELNSHQQISGTVTKYANNSFEVRSADGKNSSYSASSVRRVVFDSSGSAKFTTRTNGVQEGVASSFVNGSFNVTTASGARQFPLIFVERAAFVADREQQVEIITHGAQVDIAKHLALGNVTIVDFYADWCGPCKQVSPSLEQMAKTDSEIALRKIDIVNWKSAVVKQFNVHSIPQVNVYNRSGGLVGTVVGADVEQVKRYVAQAKTSG